MLSAKPLGYMLILTIGLLAACSAPAKNTAKMSSTEAKATAEVALGDLSLASLVSGPTALAGQSLLAAQKLGLSAQSVGVLEGLGLNLTQAISVGCSIVPSNLSSDSDLDLIPVKISISVQNCSYTDDNSTADPSDDVGYSIQGNVTLEDTDDNRANSGYKLSLSGWKDKATKGSKSLERTLDGSYTLNIPANAAFYNVDKGYKASQIYTDGSTTDSSSVQFGLDQTYTPDSIGLFKRSGNYSVDKAKPGSLSLTHNGKIYAWSGYTEPPLHFNSACKAKTDKGVRIPFDAGSAIYSYTNPDGTTSRLQISFKACGSYTLSLDGQAVQ